MSITLPQGIREPILCHDDKLTIRGQKHKVGLSPEWWRACVPTDRLNGYYHPETKRTAPADAHPGEGWYPMRERVATLSPGVFIRTGTSHVDADLTNLWGDFRTRYRLGLEAIVTASRDGIFAYTPLKGEPTERNRLEALRHRVRDHWVVARYEHNLVITDTEISSLFMRELSGAGLDEAGGIYPGTVYVKGFNRASGKGKPLLVKAYDMLERHGVPGVKLEVTFRDGYLKTNAMRRVTEWLTQPEIQARIRKTLEREWRGVMQSTPQTREALQDTMHVKQGELFTFMSSTHNTLTELLERMDRTEQRQSDIERRVQALEHREREW